MSSRSGRTAGGQNRWIGRRGLRSRRSSLRRSPPNNASARSKAMPSMFNARDAGNYEKLMGRWSRRLAPLFIAHAGVADGENVIEIGCGTGSLTFALAQAAELASLPAIDHSEIYLAAAQAKNHDARIRLEQGDGCALRFPDA